MRNPKGWGFKLPGTCVLTMPLTLSPVVYKSSVPLNSEDMIDKHGNRPQITELFGRYKCFKSNPQPRFVQSFYGTAYGYCPIQQTLCKMLFLLSIAIGFTRLLVAPDRLEACTQVISGSNALYQQTRKMTDAVKNPASGLHVLFEVLPRVFLDLFIFVQSFLKPKGYRWVNLDGENRMIAHMTGTLGSIKARFCMLKKRSLNKFPSG